MPLRTVANKNYLCLTKLFVQFIVRTMMIEATNERGKAMDYELAGEIIWFTLGLIFVIGASILFVILLMGALSADLIPAR